MAFIKDFKYSWYLNQIHNENNIYDLYGKNEFTIGRTPHAYINCANAVASRQHAVIYYNDRDIYIQDKNSVNGTFVNKGKIENPVKLKHLDLIGIGIAEFDNKQIDQRLLLFQVYNKFEDPNPTIELSDSEDDAESIHSNSVKQEEIALNDDVKNENADAECQNDIQVDVAAERKQFQEIEFKMPALVEIKKDKEDTLLAETEEQLLQKEFYEIEKRALENKYSENITLNNNVVGDRVVSENPIEKLQSTKNQQQNLYLFVKPEFRIKDCPPEKTQSQQNGGTATKTSTCKQEQKSNPDAPNSIYQIHLNDVASTSGVRDNATTVAAEDENEIKTDFPVVAFPGTAAKSSPAKYLPNANVYVGLNGSSVDDNFPSSQFFDEDQPMRDVKTPENQTDNGNIFSWIKKELEVNDYLDERQAFLDDSDSEMSIDALKRLFSPSEPLDSDSWPAAAAAADMQKNAEATASPDMANAKTPERLTSPSFDLWEETTATAKETANSSAQPTTLARNELPGTSGVQTPAAGNDVSSSTPGRSGVERFNAEEENMEVDDVPYTAIPETVPEAPAPAKDAKKSYLKPPVIDAPVLKFGRRQRIAPPADKEVREKDEAPPPPKKKRPEAAAPPVAAPLYHITLKKKGGQRRSSSRNNNNNITPAEKRKIHEVRKEKLKQLADKKFAEPPVKPLHNNNRAVKHSASNEIDKDDEDVHDIKTKAQKAKVKLSEGRGAFLAESAAATKRTATETATAAVRSSAETKSVFSNAPSAFNRNVSKSNNVPSKPVPNNNATSGRSNVRRLPPPPSWRCVDSKFIDVALNWSVDWLQADVEDVLTDLIVRSGFRGFENMPIHFKNWDDYFEVFAPLLIIDLWNSIVDEWQNKEKDPRTKAIMVIFDVKENVREEHVYLHCKSSLTEKQVKEGIHPKNGDLIIVELVTDNDFPKVFGYVENVHKRKLNNGDFFNSDYRNAGYPNTSVIITTEIIFTIKTAKYMYRPKMDRNMRIRVVSNISKSLLIFNTLMCLQKSVLRKTILDPEPADFIISEPIRRTLHSGRESTLNAVQEQCVLEAAHICCRSKPGIYMIQGPPGTGKSQVIVNIVQQILFASKTKQVILLVAPSNGAIDEIAIRLLSSRKNMTGDKDSRLKLVRVGVPDAMHKKVYPVSLNDLIRKNNINTHMTESAQRDLDFRKKKIIQLNEQKVALEEAGKDCEAITVKIRKENEALNAFLQPVAKKIKKESYSERIKAEENILQNANVIATTLTSCVSETMEKFYMQNWDKITCCIVDESAQATEPQTLFPLMLGIKKFVLVGDPQQLPATVRSKHAKMLGYGNSLFSRLMKAMDHLPDTPIKFLEVQYRMHPEICAFPNKNFYENRLKNGTDVALRDCNIKSYLVFNMQYQDHRNEQHSNGLEVHFVVKLVEEITKLCAVDKKYTIGIITPYAQQKGLIMQKLREVSQLCEVDVNTVDGFQGQERDIMVLSCVRKTPNSFLSDEQRLNVALTRAKRALYICADWMLLKNCPILRKIYDNAQRRRKVVKVVENDFIDEAFIAKCIKKISA